MFVIGSGGKAIKLCDQGSRKVQNSRTVNSSGFHKLKTVSARQTDFQHKNKHSEMHTSKNQAPKDGIFQETHPELQRQLRQCSDKGRHFASKILQRAKRPVLKSFQSSTEACTNHNTMVVNRHLAELSQQRN